MSQNNSIETLKEVIAESIKDEKVFTVRKAGFLRWDIVYDEKVIKTVIGQEAAKMIAETMNLSFNMGFANGVANVIEKTVPDASDIRIITDPEEAEQYMDEMLDEDDEDDDTPTYH